MSELPEAEERAYEAFYERQEQLRDEAMTTDSRAVEALATAIYTSRGSARNPHALRRAINQQAQAILAALPSPWHLSDQPPAPLDAAWRRAEAAGMYRIDHEGAGYSAWGKGGIWVGFFPTPEAALTALAERLEAGTGS